MDPAELDAVDLRLLALLQADSRPSLAELAERVHLSASQVQRRIKRLEEDGVIVAYVALLDPERIGLGVTVFTQVSLERQTDAALASFHDAVMAMPEIQECHQVSGSADYLLRISAPTLHDCADFLTGRLLALPHVGRVTSSIIFKSIKRSTALPLGHVKPRIR